MLFRKGNFSLKFTPFNAKPYLTGVSKVDVCFSFDVYLFDVHFSPFGAKIT